MSEIKFTKSFPEETNVQPNHTIDEYPHFDLLEGLKAALKDASPFPPRDAALEVRQITFGEELETK